MSNKNYYNDIGDLMLDRWWKCTEGDYKHTRINLGVGTKEQDWEAWCVLNDSYLEEFGMSDQLNEIFELRKRIALLECDFIIEDDQFLRNEIRRLTNELLDIIKRSAESGGLDRNGLMVQLEKWMGFKLSEQDTSVRKFYSIIKEFEKEQEALKKMNS